MGISGYISIYNDWDILDHAVQSVAPYIDELVVVDGGYQWMSAYLTAIGRTPARSSDRVYDITSRVRVPTKVLSGPWDSELQKRKAGYGACSHDFVLRFDADEILYFDDVALERYVASARPVAEMEIPIYFAPGWIQGGHTTSPTRLPRVGCLFNRRKVTSEEHLDYLWLISEGNRSTGIIQPHSRHAVFHDPIAFAAHLTGWRTVDTAVQRAGFYIFNYGRTYGLPWHPALQGKPVPDSAEVLEHIEAAAISDLLARSQVVGAHHHHDSATLAKSPLSLEQEQPLLPLFDRFLKSHTRLHESLWHGFQHFAGGVPLYFEITAAESLEALAGNDGPCFETETSRVGHVAATISYLLSEPPWRRDIDAAVELTSNCVRIIMPSQDIAPESYIRRVLEVTITVGASDRIQRLRCVEPHLGANDGAWSSDRRETQCESRPASEHDRGHC
jgi:hypothetical protein